MRRGQSKGTGAAVRSATVAAVTVLVLVAGCDASNDPSLGAPSSASVTRPATPTPVSTPSPTPTPTADPVSVAPVPPAALTDVGADGASGDEAIAVVQYFMELYGYAFQTNDLEAWNALSGPDCIFCASVATNVGLGVQGGTHFVGGVVSMGPQVVTVGIPGELFLVEGPVEQESSTTVDKRGVVVNTTEGSSGSAHCALLYSAGTWLVLEFNVD